jgi:uncharacterized protein with LGFP repeats
MEKSTSQSNEFLKPQSLLKVDDKQNLFANSLVIGSAENISQSSGVGLDQKVQSVVDEWAGKQAIDLSPSINSSVAKSSSSKESGVSIVRPLATSEKPYFTSQAITITKLPIVINKPTNITPTVLVINGVRSSYDVNSTLSIDPSFVVDGDGWKDISKVDFWLTDSKSKRVELADVTSFVAKDPKDKNSAKFVYSTSLKGITAGDYKLNAVAYDKFGAGSNQFTQAIGIKIVYQIGFDGTKTDAAFVNIFNKLNGVQILGKATNNISSITGGKVQNFEKGSIFQSTAGTFSLQGSLNNSYNALSAADKLRLGLPTANETSVGGYWHQSFQNGELQLVQGMPVKWSDLALIKDRFNLLGGATTLGKSIGTIRDLNGGKVQDYEKGSIFAYGNKTVAVTGSISTYYRANSAALGLPVSEEITTGYGKRQDFSNGKTLINSAQFGTQVLQGSLGAYYRGLSEAQRNQLGAPYTGENDLSGGNWRQFFKGGTVEWKNNGTGEIKLTPFTIGFDGNSVNSAFTTKFNQVVGWDLLGKAIGNIVDYKGGKIQDFDKGSIIQLGFSNFVLSGRIGVYIRNSIDTVGLPTSEAIVTSYGWKQECQNATITSSNPFGVHTIRGNIGTYYRGLTAAQQDQLGAATTEEAIGGDGNLQQFFKGGSVLWKSNGSGELRLTPFTIGFNGSNVNSAFTTKFNQVVGWDYLGEPTSNVINENGILRQNFQKGYITQNGSTIESMLLPPNLGLLGRDSLNTTGKVSANLPVIYNFTVDKQTNSSATISGIQGDAKFSLFNSQNQLIANDTLNSGTRYIRSSLDPGTYSIKVTSDSLGTFTLNVSPVITIVVDNPPPQPIGGGVIVIDTREPQPSPVGGTIVIPSNSFSVNGGGSIGDFYNNKISADQRQQLGQPTNNEFKVGGSLEWRQDFQGGSILHGADGTFIVKNTLLSLYNGLSDSDRQRLGMPTGNETNDGNYWHQAFKNGELRLDSNSPVKWNDVGNIEVQPIVTNPVSNPSYPIQIVSVFPGTVMVDGTNIRSGPGTNYDKVGSSFAYGKALNFDAVANGTPVYDQVTGKNDDRWFRIKGTDTWVASALINGNPGQSNSNYESQLPPSTGMNSLVADAIHSPGQILKTVNTALGNKSIGVGAVDAGRNINAVLAAIRAFENGGKYGNNGGSTPGDTGASFSIGAYQEGYAKGYIPIGNRVMGTNVTFAQFTQGDPLAQDITAIGRLSDFGLFDLIKNANLSDENQRFNIAEKVVNAWGSWFSDQDKTHTTSNEKYNYKLAHSQAILAALNV